MYAIAVFGDLFGTIPFLNMAVAPLTAFALWTAGKAEGVNIFGDDMFGWTMATMFLKSIPGASAFFFFGWTARVYFAKRQAAKKAA